MPSTWPWRTRMILVKVRFSALRSRGYRPGRKFYLAHAQLRVRIASNLRGWSPPITAAKADDSCQGASRRQEHVQPPPLEALGPVGLRQASRGRMNDALGSPARLVGCRRCDELIKRFRKGNFLSDKRI